MHPSPEGLGIKLSRLILNIRMTLKHKLNYLSKNE